MYNGRNMEKSESTITTESAEEVKPKLLNTGKAGMEGVDMKAASEIIRHASRGSNFYARQQEKQSQIDKKIQEMRNQLAGVTDEQINLAKDKMDRLAENVERQRNLSRVIVHIDMDAFYAAVEMRDDPSLTTIPMAVGGSHMLCTSNYHARKFGVRAAMPGFIAKKLCPSLVIVPVNFEKYTRVSKEVQQVIAGYDPDYCSMGLDEAYLDVTHLVEAARRQSEVIGGSGPPETKDQIANKIVHEIRLKIWEKTGLTASAGIAVNKMLAKICSDKNKPNGQFLLDFERDKIMQFVHDMPISKVCGIGNVTEQLLNAFDVRTGGDLWQRRYVLAALFSGISAESFLRISLGIGSTTVPRTFRDTSDPTSLKHRCTELCNMLSEDLKKEHAVGKTVTLKLKMSTFHVKTRAKSLPFHTSNADSINATVLSLLKQEMQLNNAEPLKLRLMGVRMSSLLDESELVGRQQTKQFTLDEFVKFLCPMCGLKDRSLAAINRHLETCIMKSEQPIDFGVAEASQMAATGIPIPNWICPVCQRTVKIGDGEDEEKGIVAFNEHIDNCLNRKAVKDVLESEKDLYRTSHKRLFQSKIVQSRGQRKRSKLSDASTSVTRTIDKFLISSRNVS